MAKVEDSRRVLMAQNVPRHSWGGMSRMMASMHRALEPFGWQTDFFTADDLASVRSPRLRRHAFTWYVRRYARAAFLRGKPYDIINVHEPSGVAVVFNRERIGKPAVVIMSHGIEQRYWELRLKKGAAGPDPPTLKERITVPLGSLWQTRLTLRNADHVLCMSADDRAFLQSRLHLQPGKITQVFPGAGPEFGDMALSRSYDRPCAKIIFAGTWTQRKGVRQVIEAFSMLASKHPALQLGVLGAGVPAARVLADFPQPLYSRITVHPPLSHAESARLLLDYDMFLLPSFFEGTPATLIEAMCTGMPAIAAANSGMKDVVEDGRNGLLVSAGNTSEIARAMERLITDAGLRERLGRQGAADATAKYTWRALAEIVNHVYCGLLKR